MVMPVYNGVSAGSGIFEFSLRSVVEQDYDGPIEIIVVDDGSRDTTLATLREFASNLEQNCKSRRVVIISRRHEGVTQALNAGLAEAAGEFIARQDADDFSRPSRISTQVDYLESHADVALVGTAVAVVNGGAFQPVQEVWFRNAHEIVPIADFREQSPFCHGSVMFRASVLETVKGYDVRFPHAQDYDFFWRIAKVWPVASIPHAHYCYRVHSRRVTSDPRRFQIQRVCYQEIKRRIRRELPQCPRKK